MKLVVGLGNPGAQYATTRHNIGFMVVDRLAGRHAPGAVPRGRFNASLVEATIGGERTLLAKPTTYMNLSGRAVAEIVGFHKLDPAADLLVIVDDLYLPTGRLRIRPGGGDGGHKGLADIRRALGREDYPRLRVGVGRVLPEGGAGKPPAWDQADFVLSNFGEEERPVVESAIERAADAVEVFLVQGLSAAMNRFNAPERPPGPALSPTGPSV
jgi:PTH1 family peptidyl-tRNA hydrolase